jgi:hypothetical protein
VLLTQITRFLNDFDMSMRYKLANLNERLNKLKRTLVCICVVWCVVVMVAALVVMMPQEYCEEAFKSTLGDTGPES